MVKEADIVACAIVGCQEAVVCCAALCIRRLLILVVIVVVELSRGLLHLALVVEISVVWLVLATALLCHLVRVASRLQRCLVVHHGQVRLR